MNHSSNDDRAVDTATTAHEPSVQVPATGTEGVLETSGHPEQAAEEGVDVGRAGPARADDYVTSEGEAVNVDIAGDAPDVQDSARDIVYTHRTTPVSSLRRAFLLLGLLLTVGLVALSVQRPAPTPHLQFAQFGIPEVVEPKGDLLGVFEEARPASLQIEVRSGNVFSSVVQGVGTGFFISPDGLVLTAYHVVDPTNTLGSPAQRAVVALGPDETRYPLELVGFDAYLDLALMQAEVPGEVPFIPLTSMSTEIGTEVLAIGNSRGDFLEGRIGEVTRLDVAPLRSDFADTAIELTAALAPGDSGGPVINLDGEAIGVVSYIALTGAPQGSFLAPFAEEAGRFSSFAIPVAAESDVITSLLAGEQRDLPVVGFRPGSRRFNLTQDYNPRQTRRFDLGPSAGVLVGTVAPGSPAEEAGLRDLAADPITNDAGQLVGYDVQADVIIAVDGERTRTFFELLGVLRERGVGTQVTITVQRGSETVDLELELASRNAVFASP